MLLAFFHVYAERLRIVSNGEFSSERSLYFINELETTLWKDAWPVLSALFRGEFCQIL